MIWAVLSKMFKANLQLFCFILQLRKQGKIPLDKKQKVGMPELHALYFPNAQFRGS